VLRARDQIKAGQRLVATSIIDSTFIGRIESQTMIGDTAAIVPSIEGRAWTTGRKELWCDPADPWPEGYRVTDTWP
jgi:proline racemase